MDKLTDKPGFNWHSAAPVTVGTLKDRTMHETVIAGKRIGILKKDAAILAFAATCPHAGAPLCSGWLDGQGRIVCPDHKYRFDPVNGRNTSGEGYKLFTYPVDIRDDEIWVGIVTG